MLIWWGRSLATNMEVVAFAVGILALLAGVLNVCWAAPVLGIPFRGRDVPKVE